MAGCIYTRQTSAICVMMNVDLYFDCWKGKKGKNTHAHASVGLGWWKCFPGIRKDLFTWREVEKSGWRVQKTDMMLQLCCVCFYEQSLHRDTKRCLSKRLRQFTLSRLVKRYEKKNEEIIINDKSSWWKLSSCRLINISPCQAQIFPIKRENIFALESHKRRALFNASDPNKDEKNIFRSFFFCFSSLARIFSSGSENLCVPQALAQKVFLFARQTKTWNFVLQFIWVYFGWRKFWVGW